MLYLQSSYDPSDAAFRSRLESAQSEKLLIFSDIDW